MTNVLVVYATQEGQTEKIARRIARTLTEQGHGVELFDATQPHPALDLARFQVAIVGAPIHSGGYPRPVARFVRQQRAFLESIPSAFFSVGLAVQSRTSDGRAQTRAVADRFFARTGWRPRRVELFAGALPYSKYNFFIRFIMQRIARKEGGDTDTSRDYEYTDFDAVDRFAREFVGGEALRESLTTSELTG